MSAASELLSFCAGLGVEEDQVKGAESIRDLHLVADRPARVFGALELADFESLLAELDGALSLYIGLPNLPPLLAIDSGQATMPLEDSLEALRGLDGDLLLRLNLSVAKGPLLAHWDLNGGELYLLPYLYTAAFLRLLSADLLTLDRHLFAAPDRGTLVVLGEGDAAFSGALLHIAGVPEARRILAASGPLPRRRLERLRTYRATARDSLSWAGFQLANITPAHLLAEEERVAEWQSGIPHSALRIPHSTQSEIRNLLSTHALTADVLFTANRSAASGGGYFESVFAGADNTATVRLPVTAVGPPALNELARWATWPFGGDGSDRLMILQNVTARELSSQDPDQNYAILQAQIGRLLNEARWHYRVFLDEQIDGHFRELQNLGDTVSAATAAVGATIDSLTGGFVEALLGAVGVVVLTLLAALVEEDRPGLVFQVGMWAYALYLVFFQGFYRMGSLMHSYLLLEQETAVRLAIYEQRLGRERIAAAREMLAARRRQFWTWFLITAVLFLLVTLFLVFLAGWLPEWLQGVGTAP